MEEILNTKTNMPKETLSSDLNPEHMARLKEEQLKAHSTCLLKINQWEKFKSDYEILHNRLETLPDKISYDIMVPFGPYAFMPGQLTHTNEILTLLGANWFADVSAKQAAEISNRRIKQCQQMLIDLNREKEQYENWLKYIDEVKGDDVVEVIEHCSEEELKEWREQHAKNVKAYKQKSAAVKLSPLMIGKDENKEELKELNTKMTKDEDYLQISENYKLQEYLSNENVLNKYDEDFDLNQDDADSLDDESENSSEDENDVDSLDEDSKNEKHVKWKDQEGEKLKNCITFTHSSQKYKSHASSNPMAIGKSKTKSRDPVPQSPVKIQSPSDIYKCFATKPEHSKPKSILKRTTSIEDADAHPFSISKPEIVANVEENCDYKIQFKEQTAFTGEIVEHIIHESSEKMQDGTEKPPSKFKAQRQNKLR